MLRRCFCGNYLALNPIFRGSSQYDGKCYYTCPGDNSTYCGGQALLDIYNNTEIVPLPVPSVKPAVGKYVSKGCWKEAVGQRALPNGTFAGDTMTPDACGAFCLSKSLRYFGLEYG
jgi:hypothetical protein